MTVASAEPATTAEPAPKRQRRQPAKKKKPTGPKTPKLTEAGREKYLARERDACGPVQLMLRVKAVGHAHVHGDWKMLSGALEDLAAAAVAWSQRVREDKRKSFRD